MWVGVQELGAMINKVLWVKSSSISNSINTQWNPSRFPSSVRPAGLLHLSLPNSLTWQADRLPQLCPINKQLMMKSCDCCLQDSAGVNFNQTKTKRQQCKPSQNSLIQRIETVEMCTWTCTDWTICPPASLLLLLLQHVHTCYSIVSSWVSVTNAVNTKNMLTLMIWLIHTTLKYRARSKTWLKTISSILVMIHFQLFNHCLKNIVIYLGISSPEA